MIGRRVSEARPDWEDNGDRAKTMGTGRRQWGQGQDNGDGPLTSSAVDVDNFEVEILWQVCG